MIAIPGGSFDLIKLLVESGANINLEDNDGYTALMRSVYYKHTEIVSLLLSHGADIDKLDNVKL